MRLGVLLLTQLAAVAAELPAFTSAGGAILQTAGTRVSNLCPRQMVCGGLWVAPSGASIAFVARRQSPRREQGSAEIFVATQADGYVPVRAVWRPIRLGLIDWSTFEGPSLSQDGKILFFVIPDVMTEPSLMAKVLGNDSDARVVGRFGDYCPLWGTNPFDEVRLLVTVRSSGTVESGVNYPCRFWSLTGPLSGLGGQCSFEEVAKNVGAVCARPTFNR